MSGMGGLKNIKHFFPFWIHKPVLDIYKCPKSKSYWKNPKNPLFLVVQTIMVSFSEKYKKMSHHKILVFDAFQTSIFGHLLHVLDNKNSKSSKRF